MSEYYMREQKGINFGRLFQTGQAGERRLCDCCRLPKEDMLSASFSFCDEYSCGMDLCFDCILELAEKIKDFQRVAVKKEAGGK